MTYFTDLIDALGKVAGGLKASVNLPKAERETKQLRWPNLIGGWGENHT